MKHLLLAVLSAFLLPLPSSAATFQTGEVVEVQAPENTYAFGEILRLSSEAKDDIYFLGKTISVNARVRGDAALAGENIMIEGKIDEDLHAAGMSVVLGSAVGGDALMFGQRIAVTPEATIGGTALLFGQKVTAEGVFARAVQIRGGEVFLDGAYEGDVTVRATENFAMAEGSHIRGNLRLTLPEGMAVSIPEGAVQGSVNRETLTLPEDSSGRSSWNVLSLLSKILLGSLIIFFARTIADQYGTEVQERYWRVLGVGILALILPPLGALLLFFLVLTVPLALIALALWASMLYLGSLLAGLVLVHLFLPFTPHDSSWNVMARFALATVTLSLMRFLPVIGPVLVFVMFLLSLGSFALYQWSALRALRGEGLA